jgi:hypothetical protein
MDTNMNEEVNEAAAVTVVNNISGGDLAKRTEWMIKRNILVATADGITVVENQQQFEQAGALQTDMTRHIKELETARMELTRPIDQLKKDIMAQEKVMVDAMSVRLAKLKTMNNAYATAQSQAAEAERRRIEQEQRAEAERLHAEQVAKEEADAKARALFGDKAVIAEAPPPTPVAVAPTPVVQAPKTFANKMVEVWGFEIVDANAVPCEFKVVDETRVRKWLQYQKSLGATVESLSVPGIKFNKSMQVQAK